MMCLSVLFIGLNPAHAFLVDRSGQTEVSLNSYPYHSYLRPTILSIPKDTDKDQALDYFNNVIIPEIIRIVDVKEFGGVISALDTLQWGDTMRVLKKHSYKIHQKNSGEYWFYFKYKENYYSVRVFEDMLGIIKVNPIDDDIVIKR